MGARDRPGSGELTLGGNQNAKVGCYISSHRAGGSAVRIHWNRFRRGWDRQIPLLPVPGHMPDFLGHRHICREEGDVINFQIRCFSNAV